MWMKIGLPSLFEDQMRNYFSLDSYTSEQRGISQSIRTRVPLFDAFSLIKRNFHSLLLPERAPHNGPFQRDNIHAVNCRQLRQK